jgi:hypothetical protein
MVEVLDELAGATVALMFDDGLALVGELRERRDALVLFAPWGRAAEWFGVTRIHAAAAFGEYELGDRRSITARQQRGLGAVELEPETA